MKAIENSKLPSLTISFKDSEGLIHAHGAESSITSTYMAAVQILKNRSAFSLFVKQADLPMERDIGNNIIERTTINKEKYFKDIEVLRFHNPSLRAQLQDTLELTASQCDAPFPNCFLEAVGEPLCTTYNATREISFSILGILATEHGPGHYGSICLVLSLVNGKPHIENEVIPVWIHDKKSIIADVLTTYFNSLNTLAAGTEPCKVRVPYGTGKNRAHVISRIIHVGAKQNREAIKSVYGREIDWTHRFSVRGHWRKIEGIGKNRAGEYCVKDFTWVTNHIRGPDHLPLIKKTRIIDTPAP